MSTWYGEVLYRQGWYVTRHDTEAAAEDWCFLQRYQAIRTVNPVRSHRVRQPRLPDGPPVAPVLTFDEAWPAP